jgi:guanylate kinase
MADSWRRGVIFILSAPSGAGKTTISKAALKAIAGLEASVSLTTRAPRENEIDGVDYHFVSEEEFIARKAAGEMAESARVFDACYGTPRYPL